MAVIFFVVSILACVTEVFDDLVTDVFSISLATAIFALDFHIEFWGNKFIKKDFNYDSVEIIKLPSCGSSINFSDVGEEYCVEEGGSSEGFDVSEGGDNYGEGSSRSRDDNPMRRSVNSIFATDLDARENDSMDGVL